jgi:hypothetical protein
LARKILSHGRDRILIVDLIYIYISIDRWMIDRHLADRNLVETSIVHILDDDIASLDTRYDTNMSIVSIVSRSRELYDSTYYRSRSCFDSFFLSVSHPR